MEYELSKGDAELRKAANSVKPLINKGILRNPVSNVLKFALNSFKSFSTTL